MAVAEKKARGGGRKGPTRKEGEVRVHWYHVVK